MRIVLQKQEQLKENKKTIAEKLIKPCIQDTVSINLGKIYLTEINTISLSDTTIARRIAEMALFCENKLISRLKASKFPLILQLYESTDIAGKFSILLIRTWKNMI